MDYDDNNFQSQNFQPVGDENKFPPSLRSFALPKFDLDEHLQVHLRFDGLVNTDVLLGIRNQDNNWIEDFSSGTSVIEFSSSAADNCSISRHNNVWSEATSSESVELLLKSVGEDEMNGRKSTRMEDAQNLLSGMINRVDPALRQVDNDNYRMVDIIQEDPSLPPDKFQRNLLGQDKEGSGFQSLAHGMPEISRAELDASSVGDEIQSDRKIGAGQCISDETATPQFDSTNNTCLVTSETSCKTVNNDKPSATDFMKGSDGCWDTIKVARGSLDPITQTGNQEQVVDDEQTLVNMAERSDLLSNDPKDRSQISRHAERSEHFMEGHEVDTHLCTAVCSSSLEHTKDSLMLGSEGCNMSSFSGHPDGLPEAIAYEVKALKNDNKADNNNAMQEHEMNTPEIKSEKFVQTHYLDISKGNICSQLTGPNEEGTSSNSEVEVNASIHMNSETQLKEKEVEKSSDNSLCQGSHTLEGTFEEKNVEAEAVKEVEESGSELIDSENILSDILPKVAEPSASSLEVSDGAEDVGPSISPANTNLNNDNAAKWEVGSARSAGQNSVDGGVTLNSPAKKVAHDGSVGDLTSMGVGLPSIKTYTSDDVSHPSGSLARDGAREKTEATSPKSIELESVWCDVKEVKTTGISSVSGLNSSLDAQFPIESVIVADPIAPACSSPSEVDQDVQVGDKVAVLEEAIKCHQSQDSSAADVVREQQEMTMASQFSSDFVPPDEIEAKISGNSNLIKSKGYIDDRQLAESDAENYHLSSTTKPQTVLMELHSTYVENYVTSQGELQSSVHKPVTQKEAILVEGNLVIHCSPVKKKDNSYTPEASFHEKDDTILIISADLPRHDVGRMLPEPSPSVERTSASPVDSGMSTSTMLTRSNTEEHLSAVETPKPSLLEPSCGLPTVMSSVHYHDEPEGGNNDNIKQTTLGSKDGTASEDDRSFTFEVGRVKELSVKDPGQWNPFASLMSSSKLPKITEGSSWGCHSESGRKHGVITKPDSEDKPHGTRCSNEKLTTLRSQPAEETSTLKKSTDSVGKSCTTSSAPIGTVNSGMQLEEIKANTCAESNHTKSSGSTFEVGRVKELSVKDPGQWNPFASLMSSSKLPKITEGSSWGCHSESGRKQGVITKPDSEDKPHGTRCSNEKLTTPRSKPAEGTSTLNKSTDSVGKSCTTSSPPIGTVSSGMQLEEIKANTFAESNHTKSSGSTFEVGRVKELFVKDPGQWNPFASLMSSSKLPKITEGSSWGCHSESGRKHGVITKPDSEDKPHGTRCSNEKLTTPSSKPAEGTSTLNKSTDSVGKSCTTSSAPIGTVSSGMQLEEIKANTCAESNHSKSSGSTVAQSSSLPDLNSSSATLFLQPFTDIQQVQLRAQIFVYGSLIQSIPPDEACMQSAFGETDGGRSSWESVWHKSVERYQNQKPPINPETTLISHSVAVAVARVPEQVTMSISVQIKTTNSSAGSSVGKVIATDAVNATPPLESPLWSISMHDGLHSSLPRGTQLDFNQALSPLPSYPSSQSRQFTSTTSPWLPQNPCPGPWAVSTQSPAINAATQYSTVPVIETVQVTPFIEASMPHPTSVQRASPSPLLLASSPASVPWTSIVHLETQKETSSHVSKNTSASQKSRKKKKAPVSQDFAETIPVCQSPAEAASVSALTETLSSASPGMPSSANMPLKVASEPFVSTMTHLSPKKYQIIGSDNTEQRVIFSEETCNKIEQTKLQAETAAALAASVASHSQGIWNQLATHMNSGLVTEVEEKLSSAAVAAAAAASVAKVAAAAAKIASDAALQAKKMADEALDSAKTGTVTEISDAVFDAGKNLTRLIPGSILKGKDNIHGSSSSISAACEAARRKVEAASAATKRAENLDAIMKAADLAAEAVSQVGTIIAMGDPLPLTLKELVEAGPDASWKTYRSTSEKLYKSNNEGSKDLDHNGYHYDETPVKNKEMQNITIKDGIHDEKSIQCGDNGQGLGTEVGNPSTLTNDSHEMDHSRSNLKDVIQKGSIVEVISDEDGLSGGWFSARVLDVKDNRAHICYNNLHSDDGSGQLKEWISLDSEINGAPRIRIAHPLIGMKHAGTRKRRREAYAWEVGDRVDAWMRDGWWECIVTGNSQEDETKLTVNFPAGSGTSHVRSWDLRPSLAWKDSQWIEWSRPRENVLIPYEGEAPQKKRQKLSGTEAKIDVEVDGSVSKPSKKMPPEDSVKAGALRPLNLSAKDKFFSGGKNAREANLSDALKVKRTGLQKEGSRVVFGVPTPGKKKKFMEVSKHFVTDKTQTSQGNDSTIAKFLMPHASRPGRNTTKIDPKGKPPGDSKFPGVKSVKSQTSQNKSTSQKDSLLVTTMSTPNVEKNGHVCLSNVRTAISNEENNSEKKPLEVVSFPSRLGTTESLVDVSSVQSLPTIPASKKKNSSTVEDEQGVKGKVTPALDKSTRRIKKPSENTGKAIPDTIEPRRSNRRIQPTSRLLEGLQSSLIISKIPALSHDKGSKAPHRSSHSKGNTRGS